MTIRVLTIKDVPEMAEILAGRHKEERLSYPCLNLVFEEKTLLEAILSKKFEAKRTIAVGAFVENKLQGFIISIVKTDNVFGRCAWVTYDGSALAKDVDTQLYRHLYADIAKRWIEVGCLKHFVIIPAGQQEVVDAWLNSGFAYEQVFGIKKLEEVQEKPIENVSVRKAIKSDQEDLKSISGHILSYQAGAPTYAAALPEMFEEIKEGYGGLVDDEEAHVLLAYQEDELLGFTCGYFEEENTQNMMVPSKSFELGVAGTFSSAQNKGIGTLLSSRLFNDAIRAGYETSSTDWRITNLKSSVFWPKMGYEPYAYRMVRSIDPRVQWADGVTRL